MELGLSQHAPVMGVADAKLQCVLLMLLVLQPQCAQDTDPTDPTGLHLSEWSKACALRKHLRLCQKSKAKLKMIVRCTSRFYRAQLASAATDPMVLLLLRPLL